MLVSEGRGGETGVPGENLSVQSREPTNPTHIWPRIWELNPGHIRFIIYSQMVCLIHFECNMASLVPFLEMAMHY